MAPDAITLMTFCLVANVAISHFRELSKYFQYSHAIVYYRMAKALNLAKSYFKKMSFNNSLSSDVRCFLVPAPFCQAGVYLLWAGCSNTVTSDALSLELIAQAITSMLSCFHISPRLLIKPLISAFAPHLLKTSPSKIFTFTFRLIITCHPARFNLLLCFLGRLFFRYEAYCF